MDTSKSLFDNSTYKECVGRIEKLTPETQPIWGKMNSAQMLAHCSEVQEVMNGKELKNTPFIVKLFKGYIKKMVINDKQYPKNSKTHPQYVVADKRAFQTEQQRIIDAITAFNKQPGVKTHTLFGKLSEVEAGWASYKHLNYHLEQFGA